MECPKEIKDYNDLWSLRDVLGKGGFGTVYRCVKNGEKEYAIKIEPVSNGALFSERNFYIRFCKENIVNDFKNKNRLMHLAIPLYVSSGVYQSYRYLVTDIYDKDLQYLLIEQVISPITLLKAGLQILHAIEYIHSKEYVHADIKPSNILRGFNGNVYLVDYGLVHNKGTTIGKFKNEGTIEYCSVDSHQGRAPSPRGDLETLGYNLLDWLTRNKSNLTKLPWQHLIRDRNGVVIRDKVSSIKELMLSDPDKFVTDTLSRKCIGLVAYFTYRLLLKYDESINYNLLQSCICAAIKEHNAYAEPYTDVVLEW